LDITENKEVAENYRAKKATGNRNCSGDSMARDSVLCCEEEAKGKTVKSKRARTPEIGRKIFQRELRKAQATRSAAPPGHRAS
jgi:hypothetical protein